MGLQKCGLNLNRVSRELQPHGTYDFPCAGYASLHTDKPEDAIPWHWHKEIEIIYVRDGTIKLQIPAKSFLLKRAIVLRSIPISFIMRRRMTAASYIPWFSVNH